MGRFENGLEVEIRPTRASELVIVRGRVELSAAADPMFILLTSAEGARLLDPATTCREPRPHARLPWHDRCAQEAQCVPPICVHLLLSPPLLLRLHMRQACRAEVVVEAAAMAEGIQERTFVVCNLVDHSKRLFTSKSILDRDLPPVSLGSLVSTAQYLTVEAPLL